jgi:ketosteroid isomerase-like protein
MKISTKIFAIYFSIVIFSLSIFAQNSDLILETGVKPHKEIDEIYKNFSKGYKELNVDLVTNLYTEDANYLASGNKMTDGREKIRENFASFFESVKKNGDTMNIQFRILQREVDKKLGYEVGIYTLTTFKDGKQIGIGQGKFFVVTKKIGEKWYFRFDGYSGIEPDKN